MSASAVALFDPASRTTIDAAPPNDGDPRLQWTLRHCWETYVKPEMAADACRRQTYAQYNSMLNAWERLTGNPAVGTLTDRSIEDWRAARLEETCHATVDKDARMLRRIFNLIGPRTREYRSAAEILLPWPPEVRQYGAKGKRTKRKRPVTPEIWRVLCEQTRCWHLSLSAKIPGPLAGRAAIIGVHSTGLRESDLFSLTWGNVVCDPQCPVPGWDITHEHGWLWISGDNPDGGLQEATKTGKEHCIPLTRCFRETLDAMRTMLGRPSPHAWLLPLGGPSASMARIRLTFLHLLNNLAELGEPHYTWHPLRLGANEAWHAAHAGSGNFLLQHGMSGVNEQFYRTGIMDLVKAAQAIDGGPFPALN